MTRQARLAACLRILGISPKLETFPERKLLQKLVYLLQKSGVDLQFCYNWYLHGPYSPDLTRILYEMTESCSSSPTELNSLEVDRINRLKSFLGEDIRSPDTLELLVSIHYLRDRARALGASDEDVIEAIKKTKPYFTDEEIRQCWQRSTQFDSIQI
jgi:uncharacterized protein YwgA